MLHIRSSSVKTKDHRSRQPLLQTLIPLHINRWRRSHHYTNEFLNNINLFDRRVK